MTKYAFRDEPLFLHNGKSANPQVIGEALAKINEANGGLMTPNAIVTAAARARHPLNKHFEWDDKLAGPMWRLEQARQLVRVIRVVDDDQPAVKRYAFISVRTEEGRGYVTPTKVIDNSILQARVLEMAERELAAIERRYRELTDLCTIISEWRGRLADRRRQLLADPPLRANYG